MSGETEPSGDERQVTISEAVSLAVQLHRQGRLAEAETLYRAVLEAAPDHPDALNFLGVLSDRDGRSAEAERLIRRAVELAPEHADFLNNLGNVLKGRGRLQEAETAYRRVLEMQPEHPGSLNNLGVVLKAQGRLEEAASALRATVARWPEHAGAHLNLGNVLRRLGRIQEAVASHLEAIALHPQLTDSVKLRVYALHSTGRDQAALNVLDEWLASEPENPVAVHLRAAVSGEGVPERASDRFVQETFDKFAGHFDELLRHLGYQAPELLAEAVAEALPPPAANLRVADAGCGTGLCGPLLRPYAAHLAGVDLSSGMIDRARKRGVYDDLVTAELTEFLSERPGTFDLIVSADTLCYFGALDAALQAAAAALRPQGFVAFTLEGADAESAPHGFVLEHHGRYRHSEAYVRSCLAGARLHVRTLRTATLRMEAGGPVEGLVVLAARPRQSGFLGVGRHTLPEHHTAKQLLWGSPMTDLPGALKSLAHQYSLSDIYAFGSRAQEIAARVRGQAAAAQPDSDVDIGVRPRPGTRLAARERVRLTIELEDFFGTDRVDLVVLPEAPAFLALEVAQGELLHCEDEEEQAEYELYVLRRAGDLAPFERERREMILGGGGR